MLLSAPVDQLACCRFLWCCQAAVQLSETGAWNGHAHLEMATPDFNNMGGVRLGSKQCMYICVLHGKDWFELFVTGGMGGVIVGLLSQEGYKDIRYYCVIVPGGI